LEYIVLKDEEWNVRETARLSLYFNISRKTDN